MEECELSSSDSEDLEYVPEELPSSCSDGSEGELEERAGGIGRGGGEGRETAQRGSGQKRGRRKVKQAREGRRKGGIQLEGGDKGGGSHADQEGSALVGEELREEGKVEEEEEGEEEEEEEGEGREEVKKRARVDDLWASFQQDTGLKARTAPAKSSQPKTVKIKQTYDFAGEEVVVEKEVAVDSREAKTFLQSRTANQPVEKTDPALVSEGRRTEPEDVAAVSGDTPSSSSSSSSSRPKDSGVPTTAAMSGVAGTKRSSGLSSLLQSLGKKPKMSTLEKSRIDWLHYRKEEGIEEELAQHSKDGYLEKQEFLQRADVRQFELEREERLKKFKRLK